MKFSVEIICSERGQLRHFRETFIFLSVKCTSLGIHIDRKFFDIVEKIIEKNLLFEIHSIKFCNFTRWMNKKAMLSYDFPNAPRKIFDFFVSLFFWIIKTRLKFWNVEASEHRFLITAGKNDGSFDGVLLINYESVIMIYLQHVKRAEVQLFIK